MRRVAGGEQTRSPVALRRWERASDALRRLLLDFCRCDLHPLCARVLERRAVGAAALLEVALPAVGHSVYSASRRLSERAGATRTAARAC